MNDDAQLIQAALAGGSQAFGRLVVKYQDRLYSSVARVLGSAEDARDVVQDAFVQAYLKLETFQQASAFYTWLYRIAFNLAVSRKRRTRPSASVEDRRLMGQEPIDNGAQPHSELERCERASQVQAALDALSEEHRAILVLREIEGCDYEEIAKILSVAVGTVRSRLHRARMQLRDQLKEVLLEDMK